MVRGELPKLARAVLCALITIDVHARDVVSDLVRNEVSEPDSFDWLKQLRCASSLSLVGAYCTSMSFGVHFVATIGTTRSTTASCA